MLVVEDNPRLHRLALKVLGARGHEVALAFDGLEGVSVALATHPLTKPYAIADLLSTVDMLVARSVAPAAGTPERRTS